MNLRTALFLPLLASPLCAAQNLNIDFGSTFQGPGAPSAAYAGAAGQAGVWNTVSNFQLYGTPLLDLLGDTAAAFVEGGFYNVASTSGGDNPLTTGDDEALLDDWARLSPSSPFTTQSIRILGLQSGTYDVYVYSFNASNPSTVSEVLVEGRLALIGGSDWTGTHVEGVTYARVCVPVVDQIRITVDDFSAGTPINGIQLVMSGGTCPPPPPFFPSFCRGDGGSQSGCTDCPCNNNIAFNLPGGGCRNSQGRSARLLPRGNPSVSNDTLNFALADATSNTFAILSSGLAAAPANASNPCFGQDSGITFPGFDGLRCVVQGVVRHGTRQTSVAGYVGAAGSNGWGSPGLPVGPGAFAGSTAGQTRYYQVVYRDDPMLGCGTGLNTSQGVEVVFGP